MRIGIDIRALSTSNSGISRYVRSTLDAMQKIESDFEFVLFEKQPSGYKVTNKRWSIKTIPSFLPGTFWVLFIIPFYLVKYKIDLFWGTEYTVPILFKWKYKTICTILDLTYIHYPETQKISTRLILKILVPLVIRNADRIFTISDFLKRDILSTYSSFQRVPPVTVLPLGRPIWEAPPEKDLPNRSDNLLYVGNIEPRKNLLNLIKALEILKGKQQIIRLSVAGASSWKTADFYNYYKTSVVKEQITLLGRISEQQLRREYLSCKAFIYPSLYEGFGLPVLEAIFMDCLVLTTESSAMHEIIQDYGITFNAKDPKDIAQKISMIYSPVFDSSLYRQSKDRILQKYTWEKTSSTLYMEFQKLR